MNWLIVFAIIAVVQAKPNHKPQFEAFSDELIRFVNEESGASWKAARSTRFSNVDHFKLHLGALSETPEERNALRPTIKHDISKNDLPESFDARSQWPQCWTISEIRDQASCGSCWATAAASAMSDRVCIHSNGQMRPRLAAADPLSCCTYCGQGCRGGYPPKAWDYWMREGIVTGGTWENRTGCQPWMFTKCDHVGDSRKYSRCPHYTYPTPPCARACQTGYNKTYEQDKFYGNSSYNVGEHESYIMQEIMKNGPVEVTFAIFQDFGVYRSGIYHHVAGKFIGRHAVRMIGWGVENGVNYWLMANSWNEEWGENGYFRMVRGRNECGIESEVVAGMPRL
uniref:Cathepsin B-like cysteine proteinase n=3 Tax=Fasciola TaxID=6191 RepID=Q86MW7_FASGI|nr:cathepsin B [Fasciola gigantica]